MLTGFRVSPQDTHLPLQGVQTPHHVQERLVVHEPFQTLDAGIQVTRIRGAGLLRGHEGRQQQARRQQAEAQAPGRHYIPPRS
jgi:hypothetical protein